MTKITIELNDKQMAALELYVKQENERRLKLAEKYEALGQTSIARRLKEPNSIEDQAWLELIGTLRNAGVYES